MYLQAKVYHDGSHYVAIPHTVGNHRKRLKKQEELVEIKEKEEANNAQQSTYSPTSAENCENNDEFADLPLVKAIEEENKPKKKTATRSQIFNALYDSTREMTKGNRKNYIITEMMPYFSTYESTKMFVENSIEKKNRNAYLKKKRFIRKANMNNFNYFVTFTYDDKLQDEQSFRKKLRICLNNYQQRQGWRYMGVFERSPKGRLHFHGLLKVPDGTMPGELFEKQDYNLNTKQMQKTIQNTYFNERFGRSDFEELANNPRAKAEAYAYILKYIEKTGEKIIYSRGIPIYIISDIDDEDVLTLLDDDSGKMVLYDKFICWDEGEYIGEISETTKDKLRTANS